MGFGDGVTQSNKPYDAINKSSGKTFSGFGNTSKKKKSQQKVEEVSKTEDKCEEVKEERKPVKQQEKQSRRRKVSPSNKQTKNEGVSLKITTELLQKIDDEAKKQGFRSRNDFLNAVIEDYFS